jgi:hypothetical protein
MGIYNSSLTRVRPFFKGLLMRDASGSSWLPQLLALVKTDGALAGTNLRSNPGVLQPTDLDKEARLLPPEAFLRWLIQHPEKMSWPKKNRARYGEEAQLWREKLMGRHEAADREEAQHKALAELAACGPEKCHGKWWAFEGQTAVDCYLATDRLRIYIEGKRKDVLSPSTDWYPLRNQLMRNLESAAAHAAGNPFVCVVMAEDKLPNISDVVIRDSLPHMSDAERQSLMQHFLGTITWREACGATGVDYGELPDTV